MDVLEREHVDLLLTDLRLGGEDGMALIERALKMPHPPICIMMTAYGSVDTAVEAMKRGAYDFVTKPLNLDKVEMLIARALPAASWSRKIGPCASKWTNVSDWKISLGESPALREVLDTIRQVAPSSANVLIEGESGTGKELAAHAIHNLSRRNQGEICHGALRGAFAALCSKANCSGTSAAHLPARTNGGSDGSNRPTAAPFFSMKSARSTRALR